MKEYHHPDLNEVPIRAAMHALSDPYRLAIVRAMQEAGDREITCSEVSLDLSKATISHHFEVLRESGLIRTRVEGTKCLSSLRSEAFETRFPGLLELVMRESGEDHSALSESPENRITQ